MTENSEKLHDGIYMPVDFVMYNWRVSTDGTEILHYYEKDKEAMDGPNQGYIVTSINIINKDLAEIKFENEGFIFIKNLNSYGKVIKLNEEENESST